MSELKLLQCRLDGRYDIEDCLGRGSYAEIYLARDNAATDERFRSVVIKALNVLLQGYQDSELEQTLIQNFQNEAVALDRVRHPILHRPLHRVHVVTERVDQGERIPDDALMELGRQEVELGVVLSRLGIVLDRPDDLPADADAADELVPLDEFLRDHREEAAAVVVL